MIWTCDATNESDEAMVYATKSKEDTTTLNKYATKTQEHPELKDQWKRRKCGLLNNVTL